MKLTLEYINNARNIKEIATEAGVTQSQIRDWARKYKEFGCEGLIDKRGTKKIKDELTHEENLKIKLKEMEKENLRLKAEVELLKKLEELGRSVM